MAQDKPKPKSESKTDSPMASAMVGNSPPKVEQDPIVEKAKQRQEVAKAEAMEAKAVQESAKMQDLSAQIYGPAMSTTVDDIEAAKQRIQGQLGQQSAYAPAIEKYLQTQMSLAQRSAEDLQSELDKPEAGFFESLLGGVLNIGTLGMVDTADLFDVRDPSRLGTLKRDYLQQSQLAGPLIREAMGFANERDKLVLQDAFNDKQLAQQRKAGILAQIMQEASLRDREQRQKEYDSKQLSATEEMQKRIATHKAELAEITASKNREVEMRGQDLRAAASKGGNAGNPDKQFERLTATQLGITDAAREFSAIPVKGPMEEEVHQHASDYVNKLVSGHKFTEFEKEAFFTNLLKMHSDPNVVAQRLNTVLDNGIAAITQGTEMSKRTQSIDNNREVGRNEVIIAANALRTDFQNFAQRQMNSSIQVDKDTRVYNTPAAKANMMFDTLGIKHEGFTTDEAVYAAIHGQTRDGRPLVDAYFRQKLVNEFGSVPVREDLFRAKVAAWVEDKAFAYRLKEYNARELSDLTSRVQKAATDFFGGKDKARAAFADAKGLKAFSFPGASKEEVKNNWTRLGALYLSTRPAFALQVLQSTDKELNTKNPSWKYRNIYTDWLHVKAFLEAIGVNKVEDLMKK